MSKLLLLLAVVTLSVWALIDVAQTPAARMRMLAKPLWAVLVLVPVLGPAAWFGQGRAPLRSASAVRPLAPDDDPEFLRHLRDPKRPDGPA